MWKGMTTVKWQAVKELPIQAQLLYLCCLSVALVNKQKLVAEKVL